MTEKFVFVVHALSPIHRRIMGLRGKRWGVASGRADGSNPNDIHHICQFRYSNMFVGDVVGIPMPPELFLDSQERALERLIRAVHWAGRDGNRPKVVGLGSLCSVVAGRGQSLQEHLDIPVTTGHAATAWCLYQNVLRTLANEGPQPVALVGASSPVGTVLAKLLFAEGISIIVDSKRAARGIKAQVEQSSEAAAKQATLVVGCATTGPHLNVDSLQHGTQFFDIALPHTLNMAPPKERNITVWTGETMSMPRAWRRGFWGPIYHLISGYGWNTVLACLLEPLMVLASEKRQPFAQGRRIEPSAVLAFGKTASELGFQVQPRHVQHSS